MSVFKVKNLILFFSLLFLVVFIFPTKSFGAENWFYNITTSNPTNTTKQGGFGTKDLCEKARILVVNAYKNEVGKTVFITDCLLDDKIEYVPPQNTDPDTNYKLLAPLPDPLNGGQLTNFESDPKKNPCPFGNYLNIIIKLFLGICAVLAMLMIIMGGIQYMTSELAHSKEAGKESITHAIFGLLIALGAYAILNTINPNLLNICLDNVKPVEITIEGDTDSPIGGTNILPKNIVCSGGKTNMPNIVKSFDNKITYEMGAKGTPGPENTIKLDCSGFVNYVLKCASVPFVNGGTASIFNNAEKVNSISGNKINNKELAMGDLVGWKKGDSSNPKYKNYGHVMIYIGNGQVQVADSHGGGGVGKALGIFPITKYKNEIKYIKRAP